MCSFWRWMFATIFRVVRLCERFLCLTSVHNPATHLAILLVVASSEKEALQREFCFAPRVCTCVLIAAWFLSLIAAAVAAASMHSFDSCFGAGTLTLARAAVGTITGLAERFSLAQTAPFAERLVFLVFAGAFRTPGACSVHTLLTPSPGKCSLQAIARG